MMTQPVSRFCLLFLLASGWFAMMANAQQQYVFPKLGQTHEQQQKDEFDCHTWAAQQTGYDPVAAAQQVPATASAPVSSEPSGAPVVKGAARGAAMGAAVGAIAGDAGKGAAIGATAGGMGGAFKRRDQKQAQKQDQAAQAQASANDRAKRQAEYQKARSACLEAKGYSVK